jgi:hypothetical protein
MVEPVLPGQSSGTGEVLRDEVLNPTLAMPPDLRYEVLSAVLAMPLDLREPLMIMLLAMKFDLPVDTTRLAAALGTDQPKFYRRLSRATALFGEKLKEIPAIQEWLCGRDQAEGGTTAVRRRTVQQFQIGETVYPLRRPVEGECSPKPAGGWEFRAREVGLQLIGQGDSPEKAFGDWEEQIHVAFQRLYRKVPFEMSAPERAQWEALAKAVDVEAYEARTPLVLRQLGQLTRAHPDPYEIRWLDNRAETVDLAVLPPEFAQFKPGQWLEAITERDRRTWRLRKVRYVQPVEPLRPLSGEQLGKFWDGLPTTAGLPQSTRDWTKR